uniref:Uncharacterized protein n=1 Tax=Rhizophora mucronata TaxID=61149 RepID=A0A2P2PQ49_RHIMU
MASLSMEKVQNQAVNQIQTETNRRWGMISYMQPSKRSRKFNLIQLSLPQLTSTTLHV